MDANCAILSTTKEGEIKIAENCKGLFGYEGPELIGKKLEEILSPPYREHNVVFNSSLFKIGSVQSSFTHIDTSSLDSLAGKSVVVEGVHKDPSHEPFPIRLSISKIGSGETAAYMALVEELKENSVSITLDGEGQIISCNKAVEEMFGHDLDQLLSKGLDFLFPQETKERFKATSQGNDSIVRNLIGQHKNGNTFYCTMHLKPTRVGEFVLHCGHLSKLDTSVDALFTVDENEVIINYTQSFVHSLFGYKKNELKGIKISSLIRRKRTSGNGGHGRSKKRKHHHSSSAAAEATSTTQPSTSSSTATAPLSTSTSTQQSIAQHSNPSAPTSLPTGSTAPSAMPTTSPTPTPVAPITPPVAVQTTSPVAVQSTSPETSHQAAIPPPNASAPAPPNPPQQSNPSGRYHQDTSGKIQFRHKDGSAVPIHLEAFPFIGDNGKQCYSMKIKRIGLTETPTKVEKSLGDYSLLEVVGEGSSGKVKRAMNSKTKQMVAIKIIQKRKLEANEIERTKREIQIMKQLDHENIIKLYDVIETPHKLNIVMELIDGSDLMTYVVKSNGLSEAESHKLFSQILSAVSYCHSVNIVHRDIKHKNIMIGKDGNAKLIDFGLSNFLSDGKLGSTFCGTPAYAAPEMLLGQKYVGSLIDVWSLGVVFYTMLTGKFPFNNVSELLVGNFVEPEGISPECCDLLKKMLVVKPEFRAHLQDIMQHPWLTKGPPSKESSPSLLAGDSVKEIDDKKLQDTRPSEEGATPIEISSN